MTQRDPEARDAVDVPQNAVDSTTDAPEKLLKANTAADADLDFEFAQGAETAQSIADAAEAKDAAKVEDAPETQDAQDVPDDERTDDEAAHSTENATTEASETPADQVASTPDPAESASPAETTTSAESPDPLEESEPTEAPSRPEVAPAAAVAKPVAVRPVKAPISGLRRKVDSTAALRKSLDAKEAEAQELRDSLEQLRRELDAEVPTPTTATAAASGAVAGAAADSALFGATDRSPDQVPPVAAPHDGAATTVAASGPQDSRLRWPMILLAAAMALLLIWLLSRCDSSNSSGTPGAASSSTVTASGSSATSSAGSATTGASAVPSASPTPLPWHGTMVTEPPGLPANGVGINEPGDLVEFTLNADNDSLDVYESLLREAPTTDALKLVVPTTSRTPQPVPEGLHVTLDGRAATATAAGTGAWRVDSGGQPWSRAVVRYRLTKAMSLSRPGRAEGVVVSLAGTGAPIMLFRTTNNGIVQMSCQQTPGQQMSTVLCQSTEPLPGGGTEHSATVDPNLLPAVNLSINVPK